jgi:hypothetical protein
MDYMAHRFAAAMSREDFYYYTNIPPSNKYVNMYKGGSRLT